ncbi:MAG TPA: geranylgeranyl reductase family protein [Polyangiaceae bacterium]
MIIVGAGPGGSNAARVALDGGLSVVQLDARRFPRVKPCAGGITRKAERALALELAPSVRGRSRSIEFNFWRKRTNRFTDDEAIVSFVCRAEFDQDLVRQNGRRGRFEFFDGERVERITYDGLFHVRTTKRTLSARQLVGADGAYSVVNRTFRIAKPRGLATALEVNVARSRLAASARFVPCVDYGVLPEGYGWIFPKDDQLSIGLYTLRPKVEHLRERLVEYMASKGALPSGDPLDGFEAHRIPVGGFGQRAPAAPVYVVGDAAGLADALTGEGIYHALESGRIAGETLCAVATGRASHRSYYRRLWRSVLSDTTLTYALARQFHRDTERGMRLLENPLIWRPLTYGYSRGATFTGCVLRGAQYFARSLSRTTCHKASWREARADRDFCLGA